MHRYRSHTCAQLRKADVGGTVRLSGWVHRVRDMGAILFVDVRDRYGVTQVVVRDNDTLVHEAKKLRTEMVVGVLGTVDRRSADTVNPKLDTGEVEVVASEKAGEDGSFHLADLVIGSYTLAVSAAGHRPTALPVEITGAGPARQEVLLEAAAVLHGTVRRPGGRPLDDARVTLLDAAGNVVGTAMTGPDGEYDFTDLGSGQYTVIASGYTPVATPVRLEAAGLEDFDVYLDHSE